MKNKIIRLFSIISLFVLTHYAIVGVSYKTVLATQHEKHISILKDNLKLTEEALDKTSLAYNASVDYISLMDLKYKTEIYKLDSELNLIVGIMNYKMRKDFIPRETCLVKKRSDMEKEH